MSVMLETSKGTIIIDLFVDECPKACTNFLKLCKIKYYNNCLFYNVQKNFIVQTGDPTNSGRGGDSIYGILYGEQARFFEDEIRPTRKHSVKGIVGMASAGENANASQFYITTAADLHSLDEKHTILGQVAEGLEVLDTINETPVDLAGRPLQNIRIRHTIVLDDPFPDPPTLDEHIPDASPAPVFADDGRLEDDWVPEDETRAPEEIEASNREKEAKSRAVVLEMIGDLPEADAAPPSNVLFICKLNPVTTEEDLEIIFSRFGNITDCSIVRDWKTGDSLCYAFIGFDNEESCEQAYFKMNNVLIDDRRIKVDFSQSVSHLWKQFARFGTKGDAGLGKQADEHNRQGGGRGERLEIKPQFGGGGSRGAGGGQRNYGLLLGGDDDYRHHPHHGGGPSNNRERDDGRVNRSSSRDDSRRRDNNRHRSRDTQSHRDGDNHRRRSRSRSRDKSRERHRSSRDDRKERKHRNWSRDRDREQRRRRSPSGDRRRHRSRSRDGKRRDRS